MSIVPLYALYYGVRARSKTMSSFDHVMPFPELAMHLNYDYRVAQKWHNFYALTLSNINRFSKVFHFQNQEKICNNNITKEMSSVLKATTET